jgi:hypothetical protein
VSGFNKIRHKITLRNFGNIFGKGAPGGLRAANEGCQRTNPGAGIDGVIGGPALLLSSKVTLMNSGIIGGGGGGSGGDGATQSTASENYSCQRDGGCNTPTNQTFCTNGNCTGCNRNIGNCSKNVRKCRVFTTTWVWRTCTRSFQQWCPNNNGAAGIDGSGAAGANGAAASTGAGLGRVNGSGIVGANNILEGSANGVIRGGLVNL